MGERRADHRIDQGGPHQVAGDIVFSAEQRQRRARRQRPEDHHKGREGHDRAEQADADRQGLFDEHLHVFGDALVGVVSGFALQLHAIVIAVGQPAFEIAGGHPASPADLQPLVQVELIDLQRDQHRREDAEVSDLVDEDIVVAFLKRVVKRVVPLVEQHSDSDNREFDDNHDGEQPATDPFVVRSEVGRGEAPDSCWGRGLAAHKRSPQDGS